MTDQRLRQLAREASAFHTPEAEAALLRARLRAGSLTYERLELAAYCGHHGARAALGPSNRLPGPGAIVGGHPDAPWWDAPDAWVLSDFVVGLSRWGPEVLARGSIAAARTALPVWEADLPAHCEVGCHDGQALSCRPHHGPRLAVEAAERWFGAGLNVSDREGYVLQVSYDVAWSEARHRAPWLPAPWASDGARQTEIAGSAALAGESQVRAAIRSALIAWAIGAGDRAPRPQAGERNPSRPGTSCPHDRPARTI